jgi:molecular chaperone GrpE
MIHQEKPGETMNQSQESYGGDKTNQAPTTDQSHTHQEQPPIEGEVVQGDDPPSTTTTTVDDAPKSATELEQRLMQAEAQATEYKDQWLRAIADHKNYKRRTDAEREEIKKNANAGLLLKMLQILDDFERAIESVPSDIAESPWVSGIGMIRQKFTTLMESENVTPIEAVGQDFDPNLHHAVAYEDVEGQNEKVVEELQKGYKLHDRIIRPAMVKVGKSG